MSRGADLLPNPCHLLDTAWQGLDADDGYDSIQVDMTVEVDPGESASYYYSNTVYFPGYHVDASGSLHGAAYAGIQTNGHSGVDDRHVGKMAIFSAWDGKTGDVVPGGWGSRFAENGTGYTVRVPFSWEEGITYRLQIAAVDEGPDDRIWEATLTDVAAPSATRIGRITVDAAAGGIRRPITFHERYAGRSQTIDQIEASQVRFSNVTADGGTVQARNWRHINVARIRRHRHAVWYEDLTDGVRSGAGLARH